MNEIFIKASGAIAIENLISANQRKIWNVLLNHATPTMVNGAISFKINIKELRDSAGFDAQRTVAEIEADGKTLVQTLVLFNILKKDKRVWGGAAALVGSFVINYETGEIKYDFPEPIRHLLIIQSGGSIPSTDYSAPFAKLDQSRIKRLNSKHEIALFELFSDSFRRDLPKSGTSWISLDDFQQLMGTNYNHWHNLKMRVIDEPLAILRKELEYDVSYELKKHSRRVTAIKFIFTRRKQSAKQKATRTPEPERNYDEIFSALPSDEQERVLTLAREKCAYFLKLAEEQPEKFALKAQVAVIFERNEILKTL